MLKQTCGICKTVGVLAMIGALNWGLIGIANVNVVERLFGAMSAISRVIYVLVGLSGIMMLLRLFKVCPACKKA